MNDAKGRFLLPPRVDKEDGSPRLVGFELEFSGIDLDESVTALMSALGGELRSESAAERVVQVDGLGEFNIELDWAYLKRKAAETDRGEQGGEWLEQLSQAAALLVPVEVVCPPIPVTDLSALEPLVSALREAGAVGTEESLLAAYGVHINPEIPVLEAKTLFSYLQAFALLQWWLVAQNEVDTTRRISPYIDPYPEAYLKQMLSRTDPEMDKIFTDYLHYNANRNRALDLLPLLAEIDEARVLQAVDDSRIKARPTFHYRLPNCHIERKDWSLAESWNLWCVVERLADRKDDLEALAVEFLAADRPIVGISHADWVDTMDQWLKARELA
jgi:hypothetical protein